MRVLVFGNSHAACLMEAWREGDVTAGHDLAFFVRSGSGVTDYALKGSRIEASTATMVSFLARLGLAAEHDLSTFDAFVVVASEVSMFPLVQVLNAYQVLDWSKEVSAKRPALTEAVLRVALSEALTGTRAAGLMADLRKVPELADRPIHLLPQPYPSERLMQTENSPIGLGFRRLVREGLAARAVCVFNEELTIFAGKFGAVLHPQPAETIALHCLTATAFSTEARRLVDLNRYQPKDDILHANRAYGQLVLAQVLR